MRSVVTTLFKTRLRSTALVALVVAGAAPSMAATTISASATDLQVNLSLLSIVNAGLTLGTASGVAGAPFTQNQTIASVNQAVGLAALNAIAENVGTGVMTASAQSSSGTGSANAVINGLALDLGVLGAAAFDLSSSAVSSTTTFDGTNLFGSSSIANLGVASQLATYTINGALAASSAINNVILNTAGLKITLNEQIGTDTTTGGVETRSLTTNAIHLSYTDFLAGGNLLNGDIIVGQSKVSVAAAVPEMATWALMIVGFGMIGGVLRAQKSKVSLIGARP